MSAEMKFSIKSTSAGIRLGEITLGQGFAAATPSVLVSTSRLAVPHITLDRLRKIVQPGKESRVAGIISYADKLFENPKLVKSDALPSIHEFAGFKDFPVVLALESGTDEGLEKLKNGKDFVTVTNTSGACKVTIKDLASLCNRLKPDAMILPHDRLLSSAAPQKHLNKAVNRTKEYIAQFKSTFKAITPLISPVLNGTEIEADASMFILINADESNVRETVEKMTNKEALRYARGPHNPLQVVELVKSGIDLFDTSYVDHITNLHQAIIINPSTGQFSLHSMDKDEFFEDLHVMEESCGCLPCSDKVTKSYIHHLVKTHEMLATVHLQAHNLHQYISLLETLRKA